MYILGIETSCDESALAVLKFTDSGTEIVSEQIASQVKMHADYGGVVPELASREHLRSLPILLERVLAEAEIDLKEIDAIGVTRGPGLKGCLLMGLTFAKGLSLATGIPLVGVNHIEGHILSVLLENPEVQFPYLGLVVSGGHTEILLVHEVGKYELIARTIDDAAGEAFDKAANLLGFDYPGGAALAALADECSSSKFELPKVMRESKHTGQFSFSGLKTAISLLVREQNGSLDAVRSELAYTIQESIVEALVFKLKQAANEHGVRNVAVVGGVACNSSLRGVLDDLTDISVYYPSPKYCTDNGAMIALAAGYRFQAGELLPVDSDVKPRWPVESLS